MRKPCTVLLLLLVTLAAHAQTVDDVVNRYVSFIGGKKNWRKVNTIVATGEYDYGGLKFPFTTYAKAPNRYKVVVPLGEKFYAQVYDGKAGWKIDGFKNETAPTMLTGPAALGMANEADVELEDALIDYKAKGHRAQLEGTEVVDSVECFKVKFTRKNGAVETYYFNKQTHQLVMKAAVSKNVELGGSVLTTRYSDYRTVDGITIPFKMISDAEGQVILTVTVDNVSVNAPVDDAIYRP